MRCAGRRDRPLPPPDACRCQGAVRPYAVVRRTRRRGDAVRGAAAGRVGPPTGWHRLRLLRQIGDQLVSGVEQFLLINNVVTVEDGAALVPGQEHGTRSGTFARIRLRAAVRRQSWRKRVGTPAAWQAVRHAVRQRRTGMSSRWKMVPAR